VRISKPVLSAVLFFIPVTLASELLARVPNAADHSIRQFLAQDDTQRPYRAMRRLEAENGTRTGWLEAVTEYSPETGFRYEVTAEGGSGYIRTKVLRAVLEGEQEAIARGETGRSSIGRANYTFQANGVDEDGLANVLLSPLRKERILVSGKMFLEPEDGRLVRLRGHLAKSPSFWIKNVEIVRSYERIAGTVVPVALESQAQIRLLGLAKLHMTYAMSILQLPKGKTFEEFVALAAANQPRPWAMNREDLGSSIHRFRRMRPWCWSQEPTCWLAL
jgi:hypothetical protein